MESPLSEIGNRPWKGAWINALAFVENESKTPEAPTFTHFVKVVLLPPIFLNPFDDRRATRPEGIGMQQQLQKDILKTFLENSLAEKLWTESQTSNSTKNLPSYLSIKRPQSGVGGSLESRERTWRWHLKLVQKCQEVKTSGIMPGEH